MPVIVLPYIPSTITVHLGLPVNTFLALPGSFVCPRPRERGQTEGFPLGAGEKRDF